MGFRVQGKISLRNREQTKFVSLFGLVKAAERIYLRSFSCGWWLGALG